MAPEPRTFRVPRRVRERVRQLYDAAADGPPVPARYPKPDTLSPQEVMRRLDASARPVVCPDQVHMPGGDAAGVVFVPLDALKTRHERLDDANKNFYLEMFRRAQPFRPLLVARHGAGGYLILDGHSQYRAAKALNMRAPLPVVVYRRTSPRPHMERGVIVFADGVFEPETRR